MIFDIYFKFNQHVLQCFKSILMAKFTIMLTYVPSHSEIYDVARIIIRTLITDFTDLMGIL